jgi:RNA exonuclease 4
MLHVYTTLACGYRANAIGPLKFRTEDFPCLHPACATASRCKHERHPRNGHISRSIYNSRQNIAFAMVQELSSNWKRLQAKIKAESSSTATQPPTKRKADEIATASQPKRQRVDKAHLQTVAKPAKAAGRGTTAVSKPMGTTQSSIVTTGSSATVQPSLALWAEDNDISPESLAEAYGLGSKKGALLNADPPRVNAGLTPDLELGKYVALDCEMVGVGPDGYDSVLARVSLVDFHGRQVYDSFVRPKEHVTDWRTKITGITPKHMATARDFDGVQKEVAELLRGRILVGHDIRHDLAVLMLTHPTSQVRDTARFSGFRQYGHGPKPALRVLAKELLNLEIQTGHHSSIEDAKVTMLLFRKRKSEFDMENANKFERPQGGSVKAKPKSQPGKKKRKKH